MDKVFSMTLRNIKLLLLAFGLLVTSAHALDPVPVEAFARFSKLSNPRMSPDGLHLALTADFGGGNFGLIVFRMSDMEQTALLKLAQYELPVQVDWVSNERLIIGKGRKRGSLELPAFMGEIIATDLDGKNQSYVYGYQRSTRTAGIERGFGFIAGVPEKRDGSFYMRHLAFDSNRSMLYNVDASKRSHKLVASLGTKDLSFILTREGTPRYANGTDDDDMYLLFGADTKGENWQPMEAEAVGGKFVPVAFNADNSKTYAFFSTQGGPASFVLADLSGANRKVLASNDFASVSDLIYSPPPTQPFAAMVGSGQPSVVYFDPESTEARLHKALSAQMPAVKLQYIDHSADGSVTLVYGYSDRDPGSWYLFNRKSGKVTRLLAPREGIDPNRMGKRRPMRFTTSDGVEIAGFMTLPNGVDDPKNLPTVLLPHGGPHAEGDGWEFDTEAQFLASRGYLVLQINYRGSQGRGRRFEEAGYKQWGTRIQDDLIEGVRWAVAQGYADSKRICSYGASFGAYSAMMVAAKAPDLFKCAIGYAGIYDLSMMFNKGDIKDSKYGRNYLGRVLGNDMQALGAISPTSLAEKIKVPVLLIHGEEDERAPIAQGMAMRDALAKSGNPADWWAVAKEGHGFYNEDNNIALFKRLETFLGTHLGAESVH